MKCTKPLSKSNKVGWLGAMPLKVSTVPALRRKMIPSGKRNDARL
nr:hypothetical protein [Crenothrix polyspora]